MLRRRRPIFAAVSSIALGLCLSACNDRDDVATLGQLDTETVRAQVAYLESTDVQVQCGEGLLSLCWPGSVHQQEVRLDVEGPHPFSVRLPGPIMPYDRVELAAHDDAERLAFRVVRTERQAPWRQVFAGENGHGYVGGHIPSDELGEPDWDGSADFEEAAPGVFERARYRKRVDLLSDIRVRHADRGLADFLVETVGVRPRGSLRRRRAEDGAWGHALRWLPTAERRRVERRLQRRLIRGKLEGTSLIRILRYVDLSARPVLDRMTALLRHPRRFGRRKLAEAIMLRALSKHRPETAGELACARLEDADAGAFRTGGSTVKDYHREALLLAVIAGGRPCSAIAPLAEHAGVKPDPAAFTRVHDKASHLRPRRDIYRARRKTVSDARMQRLVAAAAAAPAPVVGTSCWE